MKATLCLLFWGVIILDTYAQDLESPIQQLYEQVKAEEQRKEDSIRNALLNRKSLMKQFLHKKGVCACAMKYHQSLDKLVSVSGQLKNPSDTNKYFFQFGRVYQQIGGHQPPKKQGRQ
jgi:hypothetical protein